MSTINTKQEWRIGSHRGTPANRLPLNYVLWFLSTDDVRRCYPSASRLALEVLRERVHTVGRAEAELGIAVPEKVTDCADLV